MNCNEAISHVMTCATCFKYIMLQQRSKAGSTITRAKSKASRINGLKGGRPRKAKP